MVFAYFNSLIDQERLTKIIKSTGLSDELLCSEPAHLATKDYKKVLFISTMQLRIIHATPKHIFTPPCGNSRLNHYDEAV